MKEQLIEKGIVISSEDGTAEIALTQKGECEECSAKLFCKPGKNNSNIIKAVDPFNSHPGSEVKIAIDGKKILSISFMLYGVPLFLFLAAIILTIQLIPDTSPKELFAFITAVLVISVYYFFVYLITFRRRRLILPRIIS